MTLYDRPQIDQFALNDDTANLAFRSFFSFNAGFIPREQVPDKGGDYQVELISAKQSATNHHFTIQLKSVEKPVFVDNGTDISYSFKTSRLGYLLSNVPVYGLLIICDLKTSNLYYEFSDKIYTRLGKERKDTAWENQESVNVKIPTANLISPETVLMIHQEFTHRYKQAKVMQQSHGSNYGLPVLETPLNGEYDLHNPEHIKLILKRISISTGMLHDMTLVYELLIRIPVHDIEQDKHLLMISSIAYAEVGKLSESMFFINKLERKFDLSSDQKSTVDFVKLKNQLNLHIIDVESFAQQARLLQPGVEGVENNIILRLNIVFFDLLNLQSHVFMPPQLAVELEQLSSEIKALDDGIEKYKFKIWNAEALGLYINHIRHQNFKEFEIKAAFNVKVDEKDRMGKFKQLFELHLLFLREMNEVLEFGKVKNDQGLCASAVEAIIKYTLDWELQLITQHQPTDDLTGKHKEKLFHYISMGFLAFNEFLDRRLMQSAYTILCNLWELLYITRHRYRFTDDYKDQEMVTSTQQLEKELDLNPYQLRAPGLLAESEKTDSPEDTRMGYVKNYSDQQIQYLAEIILLSGKFPNAKLEYLLHELFSTRQFHQRCSNPDVDFITSYAPSDQLAYVAPLSFALINKKTKQVSLPDTDMGKLLGEWGF